MLAFAFAGLVLANLPWTSHMFEAVAETQLGIPGTNIILPIGHWAQDGLLTIFFLTVGLDLKQERPPVRSPIRKPPPCPCCAPWAVC